MDNQGNDKSQFFNNNIIPSSNNNNDSTILNLIITIIGFFTPIVYYNNFDFSKPEEYIPSLLLCNLTLLTTIINTLLTCKSYIKKISLTKIVKLFSIIALIITAYLLLIIFAYLLNIFEVDNMVFIFNKNKNLSNLNNIFKHFLSIKQFITCYVIAYVCQIIANAFKLYVIKNQNKLIKKYISKNKNKEKNRR